MSLRHGVTAQEEFKLKKLIADGATWEDVIALSASVDKQGRDQLPLLQDVNLDHVKKNVWEPLVKVNDGAKKAGQKSILEADAAKEEKRKKDAAARAKLDKELE